MLKNIHWLGHASFRIGDDKTIYIDPWQLKEFQPADIILITHEHSDHCSPEDVRKLRGPSTTVIATGDCAAKLGGDVLVVKPGDKVTVQGIAVEAVPAYNLNKSYHPKESGWVGYVLTVDGIRIYHAGDTDHVPEMDALKVDVALLPVGGKYTMTASEAAAAANIMQPRVVVPMHWGGIVGSRQDAERFCAECQVASRILEAGG
ncbi:MAG: MBL fold metallo-hydrolase [Anaerolineae bacterium]|nr:MBL fold metallo-hydrolase [Anaerolineae bacterium]